MNQFDRIGIYPIVAKAGEIQIHGVKVKLSSATANP